MKIVAVDPFYLKMPNITTDADGTQDTLVVRVRTDEGIEGWGECDASPLVSLATYCCPMSHEISLIFANHWWEKSLEDLTIFSDCMIKFYVMP